MTKQEEIHNLSRWVMGNCRPLSRWLWTPRRGQGPTMALVLQGYGTMRGNLQSPYYIEFDHFYVMGRGGIRQESLPHGKTPLPKWFLAALKPHSDHTPWHMDCDYFKELVDAGRIVADGHE